MSVRTLAPQAHEAKAMQLDYLLQRYLEEVTRERVTVRRVALFLLPLLALPLGGLLTYTLSTWRGLLIGALGATVLLAQLDLLTRPALRRLDLLERDAPLYLRLPARRLPPPWLSHARLLLPGALALIGSLALFASALPSESGELRRLGAVLVGVGALAAAWQPIDLVLRRTADLQRRIGQAFEGMGAQPALGLDLRQGLARASLGALDPALLARLAPAERDFLADPELSPAAKALLRTEGYLLLRDYPQTELATLRRALGEQAARARAEEAADWALPPVGGKIYLPCAARGTLGITLGATMRRLGLDGSFSGVLGTWLVRLPPARSHAVAARLIDALVALGLLPRGSVLPFHLTVQGSLGQGARTLSLLHLASAPMLFEERAGHAPGDDRAFIMEGSWVLDDLQGRRSTVGPRTDFVDGVVLVEAPGLQEVEHLLHHGVNLRVKQVLAWPLLLIQKPAEQRSTRELDACLRFWQFEREMAALLARYGLEDGLELRWLDGSWDALGPYLSRLNAAKLAHPALVDEAQALRDAALDAIEALAAR
jgi:hypothetical protein